MKTATIYLRVSTAGQAAEGVSLEAQEARARAWAGGQGYEVSGVHVDAGVSGSKASNRPGLQAAIEQASATSGALVVYSLSRLARSTKDAISIAERLEKSGADLVSLTESIDTTSAAGKMVFRLLAVLAEFERDLVSERTSAALAYKKAKGERVGKLPYGFRLAPDGVHLEEDGEEQAILLELTSLRSAGLYWREIAAELNQRGVKTKEGRPWSIRTARHAHQVIMSR
jgi:DNA invertase Pin-like site-specific DNA recombinase